MGLSGLEPPTSRLSGVRSNQLSDKPILKSFDFSGDEEIRTLDPLLARQVLSQLSYTPMDAGLPSFQRRSLIHLCSVFISISQSLLALPFWVMGLSGLEPPTSRLSGVRSNRLSYKPIESGIHLLSHAVSSIVPSADQVLTVVFGMGTGVSPKRITTRNVVIQFSLITQQ